MPIKITKRSIFGGATIFESLSAETIAQAIKEIGEKPSLYGADLSVADLTGANLSGADLTGANLSVADLTGANLTVADLTGANLTGADLTGANLTGADLTGANLTGADLSVADLSGADLTGANLSVADLTGANLSGADLTWANLTGANLTGADLTGALISWQSHGCIAEILLRGAGEDINKRMVAGLILVSRDWCWVKFLSLELAPDLREWALTTLSAWAWAQDTNVPILLTEWMQGKGIERPVRPDVETKKDVEAAK